MGKNAGQVMDHESAARNTEDNPSLCVPRATGTWTPKQVRGAFERLFGRGHVQHVSATPVTDRGSNYTRIFVHFNSWPTSERMDALRQAVVKGECMKVVYSYPFYWKCFRFRPREKADRPTPRGWCGGTLA